MDARADLRLVESRQRTTAAGHRLRDNLRLHLSGCPEGRDLMAISDASAQTPSPTSRQNSRATPSKIALRSMIGRKPSKPAARLAIGRATSSSANACGPCSSCMSASHGSRSPRGSWQNRRRDHIGHAHRIRPDRPPLAQVRHFRQRHRIRPAWATQDHARYGDLVLRRLCLMAKRRHRKRQWTLTSMAAASPGYRPNVRRGNPGVLSANLTPRKCLGFKTPFQALLGELGKDVQIRFS